jgi:hypothetical protein
MYKIRFYPPPHVDVGVTKEFTILGKGFKNVTALYLSGSPYPDTTLYSPFSGSSKLSATYPPFNAVLVSPDTYKTDNYYTFTFVMPSASQTGFVDVILQNYAGYGTVVTYAVNKTTFNPYVTGTPEYNNFSPELPPWKDGIRVI